MIYGATISEDLVLKKARCLIRYKEANPYGCIVELTIDENAIAIDNNLYDALVKIKDVVIELCERYLEVESFELNYIGKDRFQIDDDGTVHYCGLDCEKINIVIHPKDVDLIYKKNGILFNLRYFECLGGDGYSDDPTEYAKDIFWRTIFKDDRFRRNIKNGKSN